MYLGIADKVTHFHLNWMYQFCKMKTLHWYFPWAAALDLYNMAGRGVKLQQLHCYHPFSDSLDIYLTKNHYENYSPKMVPIAKIWGSGSWTYILSTWIVALHIRSWRVGVREERRETRETVWPVTAGRVICGYQNNLYGIISHHKHILDCLFRNTSQV